LPKSRSSQIASGKNELLLVADAPATAKPKFRDWDHGRPNWPGATAGFFFKMN
jgi:hypothetical protein